ncbi:MAG: DUF4831 family protein [Bacteroidota bacterium]|nr:DUF4831 family protein [Bacteroidota bacterium]
MKHTVRLTLLLFIGLFAGSCGVNKDLSRSGVIVTPLSGKLNITKGSIVYALPLTVLDVTVDAERMVELPGPYSRFAEELLGLADVVKSASEHWSIRQVTIATHEELDPSEFYIIEGSSLFQTNLLALKRAGLVMDLNPEIYNSGAGGFRNRESDLVGTRFYDLGADEYFQGRNDTVYRVVSVDTAFIKIPYLVEKKQKLTIDQLAEKAAVRLMELRDGKHLILTGETNIYPQNSAPLDEMNRLEKEYTELFAGKIIKERRTFTYQLIPDKNSTGKQITICLFSESAGPVVSTDRSGVPLTIEFLPESKTKQFNLLTGSLTGSSSQRTDKLYYRVPDVVGVKVAFGNKIFNTSRKLIYQFGDVVQLPANFTIGK